MNIISSNQSATEYLMNRTSQQSAAQTTSYFVGLYKFQAFSHKITTQVQHLKFGTTNG